MSFGDRRAMRHMKFPERGILRVTRIHEGHGHAKITGIITAPGMAPAHVAHKVAHKTDEYSRWTSVQEVAVLVDRADPTRFVIMWDEAPMTDPTKAGSQFGAGAQIPLGPDGQPITAHMPPEIAARVEASLNRALSQLPPDKAARAQAALDRAFGQAGGPGPGLGQALGQAFGQAIRREFGVPGASPDAPYAVPTGGQPFGQGGPAASGFPQVSWDDRGAQSPAGGGGEPASAIVVSAQDVAPAPGFAAPGGAVDLTLEVRRADGSVYTAQTRVSVATPERRAAVATPGTRLHVMIDPNDPARVEIATQGYF